MIKNNRPPALFAWFVALAMPLTARGQPSAPQPLRALGQAPLLHVRLEGPIGLRATFYQGSRVGRDVGLPATVGLRPGYIYRLKLSGLAGFPGVSLYPSLEVLGTLQLPPFLRASNYPAPVVFSEEDIRRVVDGLVLTKVVYLERPEGAVAEATLPGQPLEITVRPSADPLDEARSHGRPLVIMRLGERDLSPEDLARESVAGTVLLPGDTMLPAPACPPMLPWPGPAFYDPVLGRRCPEEECLHDGGDEGLQAGFDGQGRLNGLDPADTVATYTGSDGVRHLAISNRVCLCVPRFMVARGETLLSGYQAAQGLGGAIGVEGHASMAKRLLSRHTEQFERVEAVKGQQRLSTSVAEQGVRRLVRLEILNAYQLDIGPAIFLGTQAMERLTAQERLRLTRQMELARELDQPYAGPRSADQVQAGPLVVGRVEGLNVITTTQATRDVTVACNEAPVPPDRPLALHKWADRQAAQVGDVVTFYLKYSNQGGRSIMDVAVADSLTGRLEYVPGSARSNRDAVFTTHENEAGSLALHWEISGTLLPGQSGIVSFQARIR